MASADIVMVADCIVVSHPKSRALSIEIPADGKLHC
jgi:hypothetical protein